MYRIKRSLALASVWLIGLLAYLPMQAQGDGCKDCAITPGYINWVNANPCQIIANVSASSSRCPVVRYEYNWGDGSTMTAPAGGVYSHFYASNGSYTVCITEVRGNGSAECSYTYCVPVTVTNCTFSCKDCNYTPGQMVTNVGQPCQIIAGVSGSVATCPATSFITNWGDGTTTTSSGSASAHFYSGNGTFTICITEVRGSGATECRWTYCKEVTVTNCSPGCNNCNFTPGQIVTNVGQPCQIVAGVSGSVATCPATSFITSWGDGATTTSTGSASAHFYSANGTYTICITEVRGSGATECRYTYCTQVTVSNCNVIDPCTVCPITPGTLNVLDMGSCTWLAFVSGSSSPCALLRWEFEWGDGSPMTSSTNPFGQHTYTSAGTFEVCITEVRSNGSVECRRRYCKTIVSTGCGCTTDGYEPNNTLAQANFGGSFCSSFLRPFHCISPGDQDITTLLSNTYYVVVRGADPTASGYYDLSFNCTAGPPRCLVIETLPHSGSSTNTFLELYETATNTLVASDDNGGQGNFSRISYCLPNKMGEEVVERNWTIYPSLVEAGAYVRYQLPELSGKVELTLIDAQGRVLNTYAAETGEGELRLPADIAAGMYFVRPNVPGLSAQKLMVQ